MNAAFPTSCQVLCTRYLKQNVDVDDYMYLMNKLGVANNDRKLIVTAIFGENGLC